MQAADANDLARALDKAGAIELDDVFASPHDLTKFALPTVLGIRETNGLARGDGTGVVSEALREALVVGILIGVSLRREQPDA